MRRLSFFLWIITFRCLPLFCSEDCCCENNDEVEPPRQRGHVQLFFSGRPEVRVQDPREDYQWPGINEDAFYDYFTK